MWTLFKEGVGVNPDDTPAAVAASSVITPDLMAVQNLTRSSRHATVGRPGEGI
jgi:hypothetical protein